jgi:hypothetical protein
MKQQYLYRHQPSIPAVMASYFAEALLLPALAVAVSLMMF